MNAILALENGVSFQGRAVGATGRTAGEVVFNTSMTGYQEILTDPSYAGQIVTMTCPQIGNYGVASDDVESARPHVSGFVVREASPIAQQLARHRHARRLPGYAWRGGDLGHRYPGADPPAAFVGRDAGRNRHRDRQPRRPRRPGARGAGDGRQRPRARRHLPGAVRLAAVRRAARLRPRPAAPSGATSAGRGLRPRNEAQHPAPAREPRMRRARLPRRRARRGPPRHAAGRGLPQQRTGRPVAARLRRCQRPRADGLRGAAVRHLSRAPGPGAGHGRGPPTSSSSVTGGPTTRSRTSGPGRWRSRRRTTVSRSTTTRCRTTSKSPTGICTTVRWKGCATSALPVSCVQYHPEASPGPHDADYLFAAFVDAMERSSSR